MTPAKHRAYKKWYASKGREYYAQRQTKRLAIRKIRRAEKRAWLDELRATLACSRCGENHPSCIEFHHTENNKAFQIGSSRTRDISIERIKAEIAKCIVLCSNCHKKAHWKRRGLPGNN